MREVAADFFPILLKEFGPEGYLKVSKQACKALWMFYVVASAEYQ